ncbi:hypothetical protein [Anabaena lutea]|uniref:Uncharacterized protein n=1 Tax=Anabaena lutea FACHB-196 TaxID=2692881 RepID=A0ABR8FIA6_9NOST|nr:hypothetical protein [Anabaena lutea]MBD2569703.1 hypothetical protein [Anabaena lutea FACHB-196]
MREIGEKSEAPRKRRTQEERRDSTYGHGYSGAGFDGHSDGCQSLPLNRDDRQTGDTNKPGGYAIIGGILSQLITKTQIQINDAENNLSELRNQLRELEELSKQLEFND